MVTLTAASAAQAPIIQKLAHAIWHAHYPGIITVEQIDYMLRQRYEPEVIQKDLGAGFRYDLAWDGERPVGFCSYRYEETGKMELSKLYLLPEYHGKGVGQRMLAHVKDFAMKKGAKEIYLNVNKQNHKAVKAYQKAGFEIAEAVVKEIGDGYVMDDYIMTCNLI